MPVNFDAVLYGSLNFQAPNGYTGVRRFTKMFEEDGTDNRFLPEFRVELLATGAAYEEKVRQRFNEKHGRTGETANAFWSEIEGVSLASGEGLRYRVVAGGNVKFVIYPIVGHAIIAQQADGLYDDMSGPFTGRNANFFEPFPMGVDYPLQHVYWFQGGPESHSPDRSWYQDVRAVDEWEAAGGFKKLASKVQMAWGYDSNEALWDLSAMGAKPY